ncbi:hypothetical protein JX265_000376 [Neoarthrinium moseri]|uniref:FAD/NAD(P)-binding domain-containing protein n=1 Tax=Neoarthrinium moseri TaxID=1658444 RepID=A0A9Q0AWT7_9PEZI|nr:uncharacterized protein JN550_000626 [Neoarthrinium moseri]KAI1851390.1 hypothetical protein JX266_003465 [Neoarthrinium moseri]KAI1878444.1 hypothetical protein JN550_000626 [Neoarthrinium moseri]KAI1881550.1 hypothetical protein JX265_000376 [Neoarthrinium moseri]
MVPSLRNIVVVGGSYVGLATTKELASILPATHRILLIEPHSHFHHLFAFPRFAVLPSYEHKAFIPYTAAFAPAPPSAQHAVVQAKVESLQPGRVILDREWQGSKEIPYEYLVVATGTKLQAPGTMADNDKSLSIKYFQDYQKRVQDARSIVIVGGGAVGVQMATDLKELYRGKEVTLVHSRNQLMPLYHEALDKLIKDRCEELGVKLVLGSRVVMPPGGFRPDAKSVELQNGVVLSADLVIPAVGQVPNTQFLSGLAPSSEDSLINPANRFIRVKPTLQFSDPKYPNLFAVGDVADSGAHKAARPGAAQAQVLARNLVAMIGGKEPSESIVVSPPAIHLTLGLTKNVIFRNPNTAEGETEPTIKPKDDGRADMGIDGVWARRGVEVRSPQEYHL